MHEHETYDDKRFDAVATKEGRAARDDEVNARLDMIAKRLDESPGGPDEDTSGGFAYGEWMRPYSNPILSTAIRKQMNMPFDLLIGRKAFDIWAPYWPQHDDFWPAVNTATKYVASNTMLRLKTRTAAIREKS